MIYFDKNKNHIIQADASKTGLRAVLLQEGQPVVYASRALTDTEHRYSNIERELLGVAFGLKRLHHYTFWKSITVETDHQPAHKHMEKDYSYIMSRTAKTAPQTRPSMMYRKSTCEVKKMP